MKRIVCLTLVILLILSTLSACGGPRFESEEAMLDYLDGMWALEREGMYTYYFIFQDGNFYTTSDTAFAFITQDLAKEKKPITVTFQEVVDAMAENYIADPEEYWGVDLKENRVWYNVDGDIRHIVIKKDSVVWNNEPYDGGEELPLKKVSDRVDFSTDHFQELFYTEINQYINPED